MARRAYSLRKLSTDCEVLDRPLGNAALLKLIELSNSEGLQFPFVN
jgi:hypothetical protein